MTLPVSSVAAPATLRVEPCHLDLVRHLLARHLPGVRVLAFGSRVVGWGSAASLLKPHADLDLAIDGQPDARTLAALRLDLDDSDLPWRVDLCRLDELPSPLRERVATCGSLL